MRNDPLIEQYFQQEVQHGPSIDTNHGAFDGGGRRFRDRRRKSVLARKAVFIPLIVAACAISFILGSAVDVPFLEMLH